MPWLAVVILLLGLGIVCPVPAAGAIYKWVNEDGSVGFSDDLSKVPERQRPSVELRRYAPNENRATPTPPRDPGERPPAPMAPPLRGPARTQASPSSPAAPAELSEEEKRKIDAEIRGTWNKMRKALKGEPID